MSTSKFQQLVQILTEDYEKTEEYLKRNSEFVKQFANKLDSYLGCGRDNLFIMDLEKRSKSSAEYYNQHSITIENDCFFKFYLVIQIQETIFTSDYSVQDFIDKNLIPPSAIFLAIAFKQQQENLFMVKAPTLDEEEKVIEKEFEINTDIDNPWIKLLESCFKVIQKTAEGGLNKRINELKTPQENASKLAFGFVIPR